MYPVTMKEDKGIDIVCSYKDKYYNAAYVKTKIDMDSFIKVIPYVLLFFLGI